MYETYQETLRRRKKEHEELITTIRKEILEGQCLKDFYNEAIAEQETVIFSDGTKGGIGEGHYYPTIRKLIEDAIQQLFEQDWQTIRQHPKLNKYVILKVTEALRDEVDNIEKLEDYEIPSLGRTYIKIEVDISYISGNIQDEILESLTDEEVNKFAETVSKSKQQTT